MGAILITGSSGAGKSALAAELAVRGLISIDADEDPTLARWVDSEGRLVEFSGEPEPGWLERYRWEWNPERLDRLLRDAAPATVFVCGIAANETDLLDRFERVILLVVDEVTALARIDNPSRDNDFGRSDDEREFIRRWLPGYESRMRALGAVPVDATQPLQQVTTAVLVASGLNA